LRRFVIGCGVYRRSAFALRSTLALALWVAVAEPTALAAPPEPAADAGVRTVALGAETAEGRGGVLLHSASVVFSVSRSGRRVRVQIDVYAPGTGPGGVFGGAGLFAIGGVGIAPRTVGDRAMPNVGVARVGGSAGAVAEPATGFQPYRTANRRVSAGAPASAATAVTSPYDLTLAGGQVAAVTGWTTTGNAQLAGSGAMADAPAGGATSALGPSGGTVALAGALTWGGGDGAQYLAFGGTIDIAGNARLAMAELRPDAR
jgi:hypothetical protein